MPRARQPLPGPFAPTVFGRQPSFLQGIAPTMNRTLRQSGFGVPDPGRIANDPYGILLGDLIGREAADDPELQDRLDEIAGQIHGGTAAPGLHDSSGVRGGTGEFGQQDLGEAIDAIHQGRGQEIIDAIHGGLNPAPPPGQNQGWNTGLPMLDRFITSAPLYATARTRHPAAPGNHPNILPHHPLLNPGGLRRSGPLGDLTGDYDPSVHTPYDDIHDDMGVLPRGRGMPGAPAQGEIDLDELYGRMYPGGPFGIPTINQWHPGVGVPTRNPRLVA